jgi:FkbM family methyltransferase
MKKVIRLFKDFFGLIRVCGFAVGLRWMFHVQANLLVILKSGNLQIADLAMGDGPFKVTLKRYSCQFKITGLGCINGIREMYVRDVYLERGWLNFNPNDTVLDLGANIGNFTNMALAIEPTLRVIAVEPNIALNGAFEKSVGLNPGHLDRTTLIRAVLGDPCDAMEGDENYVGAVRLTEDQLLERIRSPKIQFIKCDIEGGEFKLLARTSKLLAMTNALACEVHADAGDINGFVANVEAAGFTMGPMKYTGNGKFLVFLAKKAEVAQSAQRARYSADQHLMIGR